VTRDLFLGELQESRGVVVENVALLGGRAEGRLLDRLDRLFEAASAVIIRYS